MENKLVYILNETQFYGDNKTTEQIIASCDETMLYDKLALRAKELAEQIGLLETNKGKDIISTAHFQVLEGKQKMSYWELSVGRETVVKLFITKLGMI